MSKKPSAELLRLLGSGLTRKTATTPREKAFYRLIDLEEGYPKQIAKTGAVRGDGDDRTLRQNETSRTRVDKRAVARGPRK